jgi:hypothetical protein
LNLRGNRVPREGELRELLQLPNFEALTPRGSLLVLVIFGFDLWKKLEYALIGFTRLQSDGSHIGYGQVHSKGVQK